MSNTSAIDPRQALSRRQWLREAVPMAAWMSASMPAAWRQAHAAPSRPSQPSAPSSSAGGAAHPHEGAHPSLHAGTPLRFPQDHGAHPATRTEWWYLTGELDPVEAGGQPLGFQITFFRSRVDAARDNPSRFAARQLVVAHAALSDARRGRLMHDQRIAREGFGLVGAAEGDTGLTLRDWTLARQGAAGQGVYRSRIPARDFLLDLAFTQTQPALLQGEGGFSRKGPSAMHATRYYSLPQLRVEGRINYLQEGQAVTGRAWLDHEWGETILPPGVVGWDWIGMNLQGGGAMMVFRTRARDGSTVWQGGSLRLPGQADRVFTSQEIRMTPGHSWRSPATGAVYPVAWRIELAGEVFGVRARMPHQELDGLHSTGSIYWEGLSDLRDAKGHLIGAGYLEMTGYASPMKL